MVLRTPSGTETDLPSVTLKPREAVVADVATALRLVAPQLIGSWGSVVLRYKAPTEASLLSMAMIREIGKPIALHIDSTSIATNYQTGSREGIWWFPSDTTNDWLVLTNEGDAALSFRLSLYDASGRGFTQQVGLEPDATARYSVRQLATAGGLSGSYGGITISTDQNAGSLDTLHFLYDQTAGFSALLKMYDHNPTVTLAQRDFAKTGVWTLRAPMLALSDPDPALEFPAGTVLQPMLLIRNTTAAPVDANLSFEWKNSTATGNAVGPSLHLVPHQTQKVDVAALQNSYVLPKDANWAEVKLTSTAKPGDLMAIASSYDTTLKYGAQTPFSDQLAFHWAGSVWEYDSTHDSIIAVGNGGTKPAEAAFTLTYNHGTGAYEIDQTLQPDQQMWIDVGQLIRNQTPDKNGVVLPAALSMGSYEIRQLNHRGPGTLFEGKVIYDKTYGSVTYGCATCCGYTSSQFEFFYDPLGIPLDGEGDQGVQGYDTCEGAWVDVTSDFDNSWSTANHSIATVNAYGVHTGVAIGSTTTRASADEQIFNERQDCPIEPVSPSGPDDVVGITSVSPNPIAIGTFGTMTIIGSGLSGKGTPTVQFSGGGITVSNVSVVSDTEVTLSYNVSCSTSSQEVSLTFPSFDNVTTNSLSVTVGPPTAPAPGISFGGNNVTNTTQSVVVGQQIALTGTIPSMPACLSVSSESWSPSGSYPADYVGNYVHSLDSASYSAPTLNQQSTTFYWVGQGNSQNTTFTLNYNTGQQASAQVTFNVSGPTSVSMETPTSSVQIFEDPNLTFI